MSRRKKKEHKYIVIKVYPGTWMDYRGGRLPIEYWHVLIVVNGKYDLPEEVYSDVQEDLGPLFGDVRKRTHEETNEEAYNEKSKNRCFNVRYSLENGRWLLDVFCRDFFNEKIGIRKEEENVQ